MTVHSREELLGKCSIPGPTDKAEAMRPKRDSSPIAGTNPGPQQE